MGARNDAIIIDNHALYRQNWLLSDRCTFVGVIKGIFITVDSHGIGNIYWAVRHVLMLSRGQDPGLRLLYSNVLFKWI
jgi:hypothetical protein